MATPTPSEEERYRYLMLKKKQAMGGDSPQESAQNSPKESTQKPNRFPLKSEQPYDSYSYGDAAKDTGKTIVNSLANVGDSTTEILRHPLKTLGNLFDGTVQAVAHPVDTAKGIASQMTSTDNPDKVPNWAYGIHTDPASFFVNAALAGKGIEGTPAAAKVMQKLLKPVMKWDTALQQAQTAKQSLNTIRTTLGQAKELALKNTGDIPAEIDWSGNMSQKVVNIIKDPIYGVEFTPEGGVVGNIRNLDKMKVAINDNMTKKDFIEAGDMEKAQMKQFAGKLRQSMISAANKSGRPELAKSLKDYHEFMDNYSSVNRRLVNVEGEAEANKLKHIFKITSEPLVKKQFKELANNPVAGPELKAIMKSRKNRELLKNLLTAGVTLEGIKKGVVGHF